LKTAEFFYERLHDVISCCVDSAIRMTAPRRSYHVCTVSLLVDNDKDNERYICTPLLQYGCTATVNRCYALSLSTGHNGQWRNPAVRHYALPHGDITIIAVTVATSDC